MTSHSHDEEAPLDEPQRARSPAANDQKMPPVPSQRAVKYLIFMGLALVAILVAVPALFGSSSTTTSIGHSRIISTSGPAVQRQVSATLQDEFMFCTQPTLTASQSSGHHMDVWYQCQGDAYDQFAQQVSKFAGEYASHRTPSWGHRPTALPPHSKVLLFGNSHTRQIGQTLACQYAHQIVKIHPFDSDKPDPHMAVLVEFDNGSQLYVVANSYVAHSPHWQRLLEAQIHVPLADMDAVILGLFNPASKHYETDFVPNMIHMQNIQPAADQVSVQDNYGPSVRDVADVYDGPLQFVSLFGNQDPARTKWASDQVIDMARNGRNVDFLDARLYVEGMGLEGASTDRLEASTVNHSDVQAHRCTGARGGHVDLVSWDVAEFLFEHRGRRVI